jgi:anti-sigma B factor antagonist
MVQSPYPKAVTTQEFVVVQIDLKGEHGIQVLIMAGELDAASSVQLTQTCEKLLDGGTRRFVFDLKDVTFIDSAGLSTLVRLFKRTRSLSGSLCLAGLQPNVRRVFELTRLDRAFEIAADTAQALQQKSKN